MLRTSSWYCATVQSRGDPHDLLASPTSFWSRTSSWNAWKDARSSARGVRHRPLAATPRATGLAAAAFLSADEAAALVGNARSLTADPARRKLGARTDFCFASTSPCRPSSGQRISIGISRMDAEKQLRTRQAERSASIHSCRSLALAAGSSTHHNVIYQLRDARNLSQERRAPFKSSLYVLPSGPASFRMRNHSSDPLVGVTTSVSSSCSAPLSCSASGSLS